MKLLSLNFFKGKCLDAVLDLLQNEHFDIIQLQEVSGDLISFGGIDCFATLQERLKIPGELLITWQRTGHPKAYFGNATFYRLPLKNRFDFRTLPDKEIDESCPSTHPRSALFLEFDEFWAVNTHLSWGPTPLDEPYKVENAKKLVEQIKMLKKPFILSGDFNVTPDTEVIKLFEPYARNLTKEHGIANTLNAHIHRAKQLFPPGLPVDYIFTSPGIEVLHFDVLNRVNLSDHLGLTLEFNYL